MVVWFENSRGIIDIGRMDSEGFVVSFRSGTRSLPRFTWQTVREYERLRDLPYVRDRDHLRYRSGSMHDKYFRRDGIPMP